MGDIKNSVPVTDDASPDTAFQQVIDSLPPEKQDIIISRMQLEHYSGPIPPAEEIEKYEKILPGAADRILAMAEKEGNFRHAFVEQKLAKAHMANVAGMVFAFTLSIAFAVAAVFCASMGQTAVAVAFGCVPIGQVVAHFIKSNR